jgi:hypothetical protein
MSNINTNINKISGMKLNLDVLKSMLIEQKLSDKYEQLKSNMLFVKVNTLMSHMPPFEVMKFLGCSYEFDVDPDTMKPYKLHCWVGKNHKLRDQIHTEYDVPINFQLTLAA